MALTGVKDQKNWEYYSWFLQDVMKIKQQGITNPFETFFR